VAAPRLNVDVIPEVGRPGAISELLGEALALRDRLRQAQEELAAAQADLEAQERRDVEATAARIRSGADPGTPPPAIQKARHVVELATRTAAALTLANEAAQTDVVAALAEHADTWGATLDAEQQRARERAREAFAALQASLDEIRTAASGAAWVRSGASDSRWDRPQRRMLVGTAAPSSARRTMNSQPLGADELFAYLHELIEPMPTPGAVSA
jgi:hypothetical protein